VAEVLGLHLQQPKQQGLYQMTHSILRGKLVGLSMTIVALGAGQTIAAGGGKAAQDISGVEAAAAIMMASIIYEKCTGDPGQSNELELQVTALRMKGFSFADIQAGITLGVQVAESSYPGRTKPPQAACAEATTLYRGFMKAAKEMGLPVR
jgi:hypothetical protein